MNKISFNQDEILKDEFLNEQINNVSLFNKKVIFISEISDKIKKKIEEIIENPKKM